MIEISEIELTDEELDNISGGCAGLGLGLGLHLGLGGFHGRHFGGGFGFGGFGFGGPVFVEQLVPVQTETVVEQPVTAVQTTTCGVQTLTTGPRVKVATINRKVRTSRVPRIDQPVEKGLVEYTSMPELATPLLCRRDQQGKNE